LAPTTSGTVLTEYGVLIEVYRLPCPEGTRIVAGSYTMLGKASNYFDGVTSGKLYIQIPTPCDPGYYCAQGG
jgi:hypothetical protein